MLPVGGDPITFGSPGSAVSLVNFAFTQGWVAVRLAIIQQQTISRTHEFCPILASLWKLCAHVWQLDLIAEWTQASTAPDCRKSFRAGLSKTGLM